MVLGGGGAEREPAGGWRRRRRTAVAAVKLVRSLARSMDRAGILRIRVSGVATRRKQE
ncbi:MAG: hypothetical protein GY719_37990 [bacterium]|nr:hypothetical protein [bacterium]